MEEDLRGLLLGAAPVAAIVGGRVNWRRHPQGQPTPAIVLHLVSDGGSHTLDGPDATSAARVQVDCYAPTDGAARLLARAVRAVLDGHRGGRFQGVFLLLAQDARQADPADPFGVSLDFSVHYNLA